jgi:small-conductance mechanosensitive channel
MTPESDAALGSQLAARLNEKIQHVNELIAQKLEYQNKFIESRLESIEKVNAEKVLGFSIHLEEALQEIRGYKDILQQQLTLLDNSIKKAHGRMDDMDAKGSTKGASEIEALRKELQESMNEIDAMMGNLRKLEDAKHDEELLQEADENNPYRKFITENGKRVLLFVLTGIGLYLLKNIEEVLKFLQSIGGKV